MMVLVKKGDAILLARHLNHPAQFFTALAGFVEAGESIEECIHREVFEEVGVRVRDLAYFGSQPWPFPGSLMIACLARAESDALTLDLTELEDAFWVDRPGIEASLAGEPDAPFLAPPPYAIAHTLLRRWIEG